MRIWTAEEDGLREADLAVIVQTLREGGALIFPTETVYGLAADARSPQALETLRRLKGRSAEKSFPIQIASLRQLDQVQGGDLPAAARRLLECFSPGPITIVIPGRTDLPAAVLGPGGTVGVRIPDHAVALQALRGFGGPLAVTSANRSGDPPALSLSSAIAALRCEEYPGQGVEIAGAIDSAACQVRSASTVVDVTVTPVRILREGAISEDEIRRVLREWPR